MTERQNKILEVLAISRKIEVASLAEILEVSQVTIRKDLDQLEEKGLVRREHGYALFGTIDDATRRLAVQYDLKRRIAKAAASSVEDGETVMIESGSCCTLLAEQLAYSEKRVNIITNSVFIANHVRYAPNVRIILLGGEYQCGAQVTVGAMARRCAEIFFSDKFFLGACGWDSRFGFTGRDFHRAQTVRDMAEMANEIIVLAESEKFNRQGGNEKLLRTEQVHGVFTDDRISADAESVLRSNRIQIEKVPCSSPENAALRFRMIQCGALNDLGDTGAKGETGMRIFPAV